MPMLLTKLMAAGLGSGLANAFCADTADNQTATGTNQATAFETSTAFVRFTTVASGTGCLLDNGARGDSQYIVNAGANTLLVYPHVGGTINQLAANAAFSIPAGSWAAFDRYTDALWTAANDAASSSFVQSGTGALATNVSAYLNLRVKGLKSGGADGTGVADCATMINNFLADNKIVEVEAPYNFLIASNIVMPNGGKIIGQDRYHSKITLSGNIEGITMAPWTEVGNLRIIGNTSMTTDVNGISKACLLLGTIASSTYRFKLHNVILGGKTTELDGVNTRCTGAGMKSGNAFLGSITDVYWVNSAYGIDNRYVSGLAWNAMQMAGCEAQSNGVGAWISLATASGFDSCTFENNDQQGLVLDSCRGVTLNNPYFEANNSTTNATTKADLYVASNVAFGSANRGNGFNLRGGYFSHGTNSAYAIYVDGQRGINIEYPFLTGYGASTNTIYIGDVTTTGKVFGYYSDSATAHRIPSNIIFGDYQYTGVDKTGVQFTPRQVSAEGTTTAVAPSGTVTVVTGVTAGDVYSVKARGNTSSGFYYDGDCYISAGPAATLLTDVKSNFSLTLSGSNLILTNTHGSSTVDVSWSVTKKLSA